MEPAEAESYMSNFEKTYLEIPEIPANSPTLSKLHANKSWDMSFHAKIARCLTIASLSEKL